MTTSTNQNSLRNETLLTKSFPKAVWELSDSAGLTSEVGEIYGMFIPETDGSFVTTTKIEEGRILSFTKGIPIYATFIFVELHSGEAGKLYKL